MSVSSRVLAFLMTAAAAIAAPGTEDRTPADALAQAYRSFEQGFERKDVVAIFANCDPSYQFVAIDGSKAGLAESRRAMEQSLAKVSAIHVKVETEDAEPLGAGKFVVRYRQTHEIQYPARPKPSTTWFVAEDTWEKKDGKWRLVTTQIVNDSVADWKARLEAQRKQMEAEDAVRASRRCLNGLGYQCGPGK